MKKSDILWYNSSTGEGQVWYMDEHKLVDRGTVLGSDGKPALIGPPFRIVRFSICWRPLFDSPPEILFAQRPHFFQPPRAAGIGKRLHMGYNRFGILLGCAASGNNIERV